MKLCKDCKHVSGAGFRCLAPQNVVKLNFVDESRKPVYSLCAIHREDNWLSSLLFSTCGKRGRWWEGK